YLSPSLAGAQFADFHSSKAGFCSSRNARPTPRLASSPTGLAASSGTRKRMTHASTRNRTEATRMDGMTYARFPSRAKLSPAITPQAAGPKSKDTASTWSGVQGRSSPRAAPARTRREEVAHNEGGNLFPHVSHHPSVISRADTRLRQGKPGKGGKRCK